MARKSRPSDKGPRIIQAALRVFSQKGYHNTKISDIVQEAGVAQGTFYLYFPSKRDLLLTLVHEFNQNLKTMICDHVQKNANRITPTETAEDILKTNTQMLLQVLTYFRQNREVYETVLSFGNTADPEISQQMEETREVLVDVLRQAIDQMIQKGAYRPMDSRLIAYGISGLVESLTRQFILTDAYTPEQMAREISQFLLFGQLKP